MTRKLIRISQEIHETLPRYKYLIQLGYTFAEFTCLYRDKEVFEIEFSNNGYTVEGKFESL